ncbi:mannose-6-phosphate isomerase, class I [Kribbella kalugense]|uniref:mannose-6-phosphate isomerase n=1 Tax=Kribbella kalugense TaxID=2512221 RepID=A0A4R7ZFQ0_9ACTN|nr:mannose-6-phosphate isomerase, class I [Kribbella kalugense]TDW15121.1 mannose-6-phosphate isomerase type 1 [Kribbella kalugense]
MVVPLQNTIRDYAWGSQTALPELLGVEPTGKPQAEMWMGAHESAPSVLPNGDTLYDVVSADPAAVLGAETAERFEGRFPFLAKLLAAGQPLSIQAHPSLDQAIDGYARDEADGIPRDAADRNYKDAWPKPEILIALEPFDALVGFRPLDRTIALLEALAPTGFGELTDQLRDGKLREAFTDFMSADRDAIRPLVGALGEAVAQYVGDAFELERETLSKLCADFPDDPGVLAGLLLNRVRLERFDAVYLPAGNVHAYLRGLGFEVMANSDNVLRGGLTSKHVDVPELVSVVDFEPLANPVLTADDDGVYETGCPYFAVRRVDLDGAEQTVEGVGPRIVCCVDGTVDAVGKESVVTLSAGQSAFASGPEGPCTLRGSGTAFVVSAR